MLTSGQLSQQQLNAIQQRAQQIAPMLNGWKNMVLGFWKWQAAFRIIPKSNVKE